MELYGSGWGDGKGEVSPAWVGQGNAVRWGQRGPCRCCRTWCLWSLGLSAGGWDWTEQRQRLL